MADANTGQPDATDAAVLALGVTVTDPSGPRAPAAGTELAPGTTLGRYQVQTRIGSGGMGVVYRAHDPDLDRVVAIKVLHDGPDGSRPSEMLQQRLLREAKAMAKLSHPNLVTVYDVGSINRHVFIAMELVEGKTLRAWMAEPEHDWRERVRVLVQAGKGLAAAHLAGVIHRDFKPDNVLIGRHVQVVDFGLARNLLDSLEPFEGAPSPTKPLAPSLTHTGALLGTPAYMSPEQHRGDSTDERSDQFSFAVTAYHALYGYRPFAGDTVADIGNAVLHGELEPPPDDTLVPRAVLEVLARALSTEPSERFESMDALLEALERAATPAAPVQRAWLFPAAVTLLAAAVIAAVLLLKTPAPPPTVDDDPKPIPTVLLPARQLSFRGDVTQVAISPDARYLAYVSADQLIVRDGNNEKVAHTAPKFASLRWSRNSTRLVFGAYSDSPSGTFIYSTADGTSKRVLRLAATVCFVSDHEIAKSGYALKRIGIESLRGAPRRWVPFPGDYVWLRTIDCAPESQRFVVLTRAQTGDQLWTMRFDGSDRQLIAETPDIEDAQWAPGGRAIYYLRRRGTESQLIRQDVDPSTGRGRGKPRVVLADIEQTGRFSVAADGTIAYVRGSRTSNVWSVDRTASGGAAEPVAVTTGTAAKLGIAISPKGDRIAYTARGADGVDLVVQSRTGSERRVLGRLDNLTSGVVWSPDGTELAVVAVDRAGVPTLHRVTVDKARLQTMKVPLPSESAQLAWSSRNQLLYQLPGNRNYNLLDPASGKVTPLLPDLVGWFFVPRFSPSADKLAVFWNRSPRGVWVIDMATRKSSLAVQGEVHPVGWSDDGKWLYAYEPGKRQRRIVRVPASPGAAEPWLTLPARFARLIEVEVTGNGRQFLLNVDEGSADVWLARR